MSGRPHSSLYRPLDPEINEIRLLTCFEIDAEESVSCRLITVPLDDCPSYSTLSYVWGKATDPVSIKVDGQDFQATPSLALSLRCIPHHWKSKYPSRDLGELRVWADAVCINQDDLAERAQQVQLMERIYSGAELVVCWMPDGIRQPLDPRPFSNDTQDDLLNTAFQALELINRELLLVEQDVGGTLWDIELDDEILVDWLEKCPELSRDTPDNAWPFWRNRNWEAVRHFFGLQYWQRVWIFQEIVLAKEALLICRSSCISLTGAIDRVFCWFDLLELCDLSNPDFISPSLWSSLISGSGMSRVTVTGHLDTWRRRRMEIPTLSWRVFYKAGSLAATDPKDHVYGLLGATGIDVRVDYSGETSVAKVFHDVTAAWLSDFASKKRDTAAEVAVSGMKELWFLGLAGLKPDCNDTRCRNFSSWAPNFPHFHHNRADYVFFTKVNADDGVFSEDHCLKTTYIKESSLFVTGLVIDTVRETYPQVTKSSDIFGLINDLSRKNEAQFSDLKPRRRLLRNLFELLCWSDLPSSILNARLRVSDPNSLEYLAFACAFIWAVLSGGLQYHTTIERLGLRSDTGTGFLLSLRETFLDLEDGFEDHREDSLKTLLDLDSNLSSWLQDLVDCEATRAMPKEARLAACCQRMTNYIVPDGLDDCSLFRTSRGYFGLASKQAIARGDFLCALKGYDSVASLRENGDHFLYVGDTKVQGMMEGQAAQLLKKGLAEVRQFELR